MKKLCELDSNYSTHSIGTGIEIEVEGYNLPEPRKTNYWNQVIEGSLRDGVEYITNGPLDSKNRTIALKLLYKALSSPNTTLSDDQSRCSVHVHVSVNNLTPMQICTGLTVSILLDSLLMKYCGTERESNLFCQPVVFLEEIITGLSSYVENPTDRPFRNLTQDTYKYSSINIGSIYKNGSIEFRGMRFLDDAEDVDEWCSNLFSLIHKSCNKWDSPKEFMDWYLNNSREDLLKYLFDENFANELLKLDNEHQLIRLNTPMSARLAYNNDWEKFGTYYSFNKSASLSKLSNPRTTVYNEMQNYMPVEWFLNNGE